MAKKQFLRRIFILVLLCGAMGAFLLVADDWRASLNPTQAVVHEIETSNPVFQTLFSPDDGIKDIQISLIEQEKKSLDIAIFSFTDADTAHAVIEAHKRGVKVRIVADRGSSTGEFSKIFTLRKAGIPVHICPVTVERQEEIVNLDDLKLDDKAMAGALMHNKFIIFGKTAGDKRLLWTGSFNFTRSANVRNQENVVIVSDSKAINRFAAQFEKLLERSELL